LAPENFKLMSVKEILIFLVIQLAFVSWSFWEAYMEGDTGWKWNPKWWRINLPRGYTYTAYHVWAFLIFAPIVFIILPLIVAGFSWRFFWLLLAAVLLGTTLEDFMWFVVNPSYPLSKWNPNETKWYPWFKLGRLHLPISYIVKIVLATLILIGPFATS